MVDTQDLFRKLGAGAKFDFKRFSHDAEKFKVSFFPTVVNVYKSVFMLIFHCIILLFMSLPKSYNIRICNQTLFSKIKPT